MHLVHAELRRMQQADTSQLEMQCQGRTVQTRVHDEFSPPGVVGFSQRLSGAQTAHPA